MLYFRLKLTITLLELFSWREENDLRNCFMINLHESMGPGRVQTHNTRICNQTSICSQTGYWLYYAARQNLGRRFGTSKIHLSPPPPPPRCLRLLSVLRWWFCCCWLFVYCYSHCGSLLLFYVLLYVTLCPF